MPHPAHRGGKAKSTTDAASAFSICALSLAASAFTSIRVSIPEIFDRHARRQRNRRVAQSSPKDAWMILRASEDIAIRLSAIRRDFDSILLMSPFPDFVRDVLPTSARVVVSNDVLLDEDRLPFANGSFDCIISIGLLDTVNDLPGALALCRRALAPDGVMLMALAGAGSLSVLRKAMAIADPGRAHFHPQIDVRAMGDLMLRAGFAQPVVDADSVDARYSALDRLIFDMHANGQGNVMLGRQAMRRREFVALEHAFASHAIAGRITETFVTLHATGWANAR